MGAIGDADVPANDFDEIDGDLRTAIRIDLLFAMAHHAQQKVCAEVLQWSFIDRLLDRPETNRETARRMVGRIASTSFAAANAVRELQRLMREQFARATFTMDKPNRSQGVSRMPTGLAVGSTQRWRRARLEQEERWKHVTGGVR